MRVGKIKESTVERVLLDTNIVSYFYKRHHLALQYRPMIVGRPVVISFQTKAELNEVPWRAGWGLARRTLLDDFLKQFGALLGEHFSMTS